MGKESSGAGKPPSQQDERIHHAAANGNVEAVSALIKKGVDINTPDRDGNTAMHYAAGNGHASMVQTLARNGAAINPENNSGQTPLDVAIENGQMKGAKALIQQPRENAVASRENATQMLHQCIAEKDTGTAMMLVDVNQANVNAKDGKGTPPLNSAIANGMTALATTMIQAGADVNAKDADGKTALHVAAAEGNAVVASALIKKGANLQATTRFEDTPLHEAAANGHENVAKVLTDAMVGKGTGLLAINKDNSFGDTPYDRAKEKGHQNVADFLASKGGHSNMPEGGLEHLARARRAADAKDKTATDLQASGHDKLVADLKAALEEFNRHSSPAADRMAKNTLLNSLQESMDIPSSKGKSEKQEPAKAEGKEAEAKAAPAAKEGLKIEEKAEAKAAQPVEKKSGHGLVSTLKARFEKKPEQPQAEAGNKAHAPQQEKQEGRNANAAEVSVRKEAVSLLKEKHMGHMSEAQKIHTSEGKKEETGVNVNALKARFEKKPEQSHAVAGDKAPAPKQEEKGAGASKGNGRFDQILKSSEGQAAVNGLKHSAASSAQGAGSEAIKASAARSAEASQEKTGQAR